MMMEPYNININISLPRKLKRGKPVRHGQICPGCGRKNVNTYFRNGVWLCRRCREAVHAP